jgi:predicted RNase H-like HicB family nuclease
MIDVRNNTQFEEMPVAKRFYPAVLERAAKKTFAVWFPDFLDCVAVGTSQEEALQKAEQALIQAVELLAERDKPLPEPTSFEQISPPKPRDLIALLVVGVEPADPSERVNIYLPKSLIARADKRASELGMSRSSFFGLAISSMIDWSKGVGAIPSRAASFSKRQRTTHLQRLEEHKRGASK